MLPPNGVKKCNSLFFKEKGIMFWNRTGNKNNKGYLMWNNTSSPQSYLKQLKRMLFRCVVLIYDTAQPHFSKVTKDVLNEFKRKDFKVLSIPILGGMATFVCQRRTSGCRQDVSLLIVGKLLWRRQREALVMILQIPQPFWYLCRKINKILLYF